MWPPGFGESARYSYPEHDNWSVTRNVHCPICGPGSHSYTARDIDTPRWNLLMRGVCPTCGARFTIIRVTLTWHNGKDIRTHSRDFRPQADPTLQRLAWIVYNAPDDPRALSRLLYYLDPAHPDEIDRAEVEGMVRVAISQDVWWTAWDCLEALRAEVYERLWPQGGAIS